MFDLDDIREEQSGTLTVENPKGDIVIEFHTYATKQWNRAVKRYKPDLKTFIDPESGMFAIVSFQPKELKEALASLVISMKQGSDEETDSKKIKELFLDPTLGVFPTLNPAFLALSYRRLAFPPKGLTCVCSSTYGKISGT